MPIFFVCAIQNKSIKLLEVQTQKHNLSILLNHIIKQSQPYQKKSFTFKEDLRFQYVAPDESLLIISISNNDISNERQIMFTQEVQDLVLQNIEPQNDLEPQILKILKKYNGEMAITKGELLNKNLIEAQDIFQEDLYKLEERSENLDCILQKARNMSECIIGQVSMKSTNVIESPQEYKKLKSQPKCKFSVGCFMIFVIIIIVINIWMYFCHYNTKQCFE